MSKMDDEDIEEAIRADLCTSYVEAERTYGRKKPIFMAQVHATGEWLFEKYPRNTRAALERYIRALEADVEWRLNFFDRRDPEPADKADE